eukprot:m.243648 g.243648  ORF g.243648 m.243648 type:complete len:57 (+) comp33816_c0_seq1:174-344(+)
MTFSETLSVALLSLILRASHCNVCRDGGHCHVGCSFTNTVEIQRNTDIRTTGFASL